MKLTVPQTFQSLIPDQLSDIFMKLHKPACNWVYCWQTWYCVVNLWNDFFIKLINYQIPFTV